MAQGDRERWNARYGVQEPQPAPSPLLDESAALLPRSGRGLDLAGGTGRHALWMARRGLAVTLAEVSEIAAARANSLAAQEGLPLSHALLDLEADPFPAGPWDLIVCAYFLYRPIFQTAAQALAPGGVLAVVHPTLRNLERNPKPGAAWLLSGGELATLVAGLEVLRFDEAWRANGQHEAWLLARAHNPSSASTIETEEPPASAVTSALVFQAPERQRQSMARPRSHSSAAIAVHTPGSP